MKVMMLLADGAQTVNGKLYILGGGWSITGPQPNPMAIALKIDVPWTEANRPHNLQLDLLNEDGQPVTVPTPTGDRPVQLSSQFEVGRPPGLSTGTPLDVALAINIGPLPLEAGRRYVWRCSINGEFAEQLSFLVRPTLRTTNT